MPLLNCTSSIERENRKNDFLDIFILGFEKDYYGIGMSLGIPVCFCYGEEAEGYGILYGHIGKYKAGGYKHYVSVNQSVIVGNGLSSQQFTPISPLPRNRNKNIKTLGFIKTGEDSLLNKNGYYFDSFITLGIKYGIKIGINFDELFDFIVGFWGYDTREDDLMPNGLYAWEITEQKKIEEENKKAFRRCLKIQQEVAGKNRKKSEEFCDKKIDSYRVCYKETETNNPQLRKQKQEYCDRNNIYINYMDE